jgi:hypothetical protein
MEGCVHKKVGTFDSKGLCYRLFKRAFTPQGTGLLQRGRMEEVEGPN